MQKAERDEAAAPSNERSTEPPQVIVVDKTLKALGIGTFLIILVVALFFGCDFLLPVVPAGPPTWASGATWRMQAP